MIIDCIMYAYEEDALAVRLAELADVVDYHVIVEARQTFRGDPRTPVEPKGDNILNVVIDLPETDDPWQREVFQRNMTVKAAFKEFGPRPLAIVGDADEIPHPDSVRMYDHPRGLRMDYREWYADWRAPDEKQATIRPFMAALGEIGEADDLRRRAPLAPLGPRGWHLSSLGSAKFMSAKLGQFSHSEYSGEYWQDVERLEDRRKRGVDALDRFQLEYTDNLPTTISQFPHLLGGPINE